MQVEVLHHSMPRTFGNLPLQVYGVLSFISLFYQKCM
jgi:hypothetical protein